MLNNNVVSEHKKVNTSSVVLCFYREWLKGNAHRIGETSIDKEGEPSGNVRITELMVKTIERRYLEFYG